MNGNVPEEIDMASMYERLVAALWIGTELCSANKVPKRILQVMLLYLELRR